MPYPKHSAFYATTQNMGNKFLLEEQNPVPTALFDDDLNNPWIKVNFSYHVIKKVCTLYF